MTTHVPTVERKSKILKNTFLIKVIRSLIAPIAANMLKGGR